MSKKSSSTSKNSFFLIFLLLSVVIIGAIASFFQSGNRITTRSGAATPTTVTLTSLNQIPGLAQTIGIGNTFTVKIPASLYKQVYVAGAGIFCTSTRLCKGPYDAKFVASQNIWSSATYIYTFGQQVPLTANYYFYAAGGKGNISLSNCTINNKSCTATEKSSVQSLLNRASATAYNAYYQYVDVLAISNDVSYLTILFRVKSLPITPTPTLSPIACKDTTPPTVGGMTHAGSNPYNFTWAAATDNPSAGCVKNTKYFFRRYTFSPEPNGSEPNCPVGNMTNGSCWRSNLSISSVPIDFNNSTCMFFGSDLGCTVYLWAKDQSNNVSRATSDIVYQP